MQEVMQLPEVLFVELARRKVGRELEVAVVMGSFVAISTIVLAYSDFSIGFSAAS